MKLIKVALSVSLLLLSAICTATPTDLMYKGKPIDSLCFFDLENDTNTIHLDKCGAQIEKLKAAGKNDKLVKEGFTGYDIIEEQNSRGYSYYKSFDAGNGAYWIYSINNGGGSGEFTAISLVKRTGENTLFIKGVAGGDRCNGGITDPKAINNKLNFLVNLTAFDVLTISDSNIHHLQAYDDLAACAACCTATALYEMDSQSSKPTLKYIELNDVKDVKEMSEQGKYQACFNKLFASYVKKDKRQLDEAKLKAFAKLFNKTCVK